MSANQPIPLLLSGQAGQYFGTEYEGLPADVDASVRVVGEQLADRGLRYLGKLTCSQFGNVEVYAYGTGDRRVAVSVMASESGLAGIDCVSRFADCSYLTTTTVRVMHGAYNEQKLFCVSFPGLGAIELLEQHLSGVLDFEQRSGAVESGFEDLLSIAQLVDEYTLRQQSNFGHGILQILGGFARSSVAQAMANNDEEYVLELDLDEEEQVNQVRYSEDDASPLVKAVLRDDLDEINQLLESGVALENGWYSPLIAAVYRGNLEIIQRLIDAGANLRMFDSEIGYTPIGMAIKQNRPDLIRFLLNAGACPYGGDICGPSLDLAVRQNNIEIVQMLLNAGVSPNTAMEDDYRVIMTAALYGDLKIVKLLISHGADVNTWSQGETAIMSAARNGYQDVYDYLYPLVNDEIRCRADKYGADKIAKGIRRKQREGNKLLEKLGNAALFGNLPKVQQLLLAGADVNALTSKGRSPLMCASMYGHIRIMEALLDAGANPNLQGEEDGEEGMTALMYIADNFLANNRTETIKFLASRGADVNIQDVRGRTALIAAGENADSVKALLEVGADPNIRDRDGNTAMMLGSWAIRRLLRQAGASEEGLNDVELVRSAREGNLATVNQLLNAGANVNYDDGAALNRAANQGHLEIVDRLIQAGADVNLGWKTGFTPIAAAAYEGYLKIVERLLEAGANPFQRCHDGEIYNALEYAELGQAEGHHKGKGHAAIIELLNARSNKLEHS
jgi:ankyrin repeat protein